MASGRGSAVLYCTVYDGIDAFRHNTPAFSRSLLFGRLGFQFLAVGRSNSRHSRLEHFDHFDVYLAAKRTSPADLAAGIREYLGDSHPVKLVVARDFPATSYGLRLAREFGCSAYYDSVETWTGYFIRNGRRKVWKYHKTRYLERRCLPGFVRVIAHSDPSREYLVSMYALRAERTGVLYSGLPVPGYTSKPELLRTRWPQIRQTDRILVCSGRLSAPGQRGLDAVIDALAFVRPQYKLLFMGDGRRRAELEELAARRGLRERVLFLPAVPVERYYEYLAGADIGIDLRPPSSLNYDLAYSIRMVDYINCGLPVIASNTRGFCAMERSYPFVKCVDTRLSPKDKGPLIEAAADLFYDQAEPIRDQLHKASQDSFSFAADLRRLTDWLKQDGVVAPGTARETGRDAR